MKSRDPVHILHLLGNRKNIGGILTVVKGIMDHAPEDVVHHRVLHLSYPESGSDAIRIPFIRDEDASHLRLGLGALAALPFLLRHIRGRRPAVLHAHTRGGLMLALLARPLCRRPLLITHHTYGKRKRLYTCLKHKPGVLYACLSRDMRAYYGFDPEQDSVEVLSSCCPDDLYLLAMQRNSSPPRPPLRLLGLGTLAYRKGWDVLLDALALLNSEDLERLRVDLYGVPRDPAYLQRLQNFLTAHSLENHCRIHPPVDDIHPLLLHSDWFVFPSRNEPLGTAAIEALASGLPVIGSNNGGIPEFLRHGENGLLFTDGDPAALAKQLTNVARGHRPRLAPAEISAGVADRSARSVGEDYHRLYHRLLHDSA